MTDSLVRPTAPTRAKIGQAPSTPTPTLQHTPKADLYSDPIPGIIPFGTTTLLAGASQLGKTAMIASWATRFRAGKSICHHAVNIPKAIGVLVVDRQQASHKEWFSRAGWPDIPMYSYRDDPKTKWEDFLQRPALKGLLLYGLEQLAAQGVGRGSLIIVDPISPFIAGNLIDYKHTLVGLGVIDQLSKERGVTLLGIAHMAKQKSGEKDRYTRPQDRILGSAALGGFTDTQIYMLGPDDTDHGNYELGWIPHNAPAESFQFERDEQGLFVVAELSPADQDASSAVLGVLSTLPTAEDNLPGELRTKALLAAVMENYGTPLRTAERAIQRLTQTAKIERRRRGFYSLPASPATSQAAPV